MADITQEDFYKGIFLRQVLSSTQDFTITNLTTEADPMLNGILVSDLYLLMKEQSEKFALAMVTQP